MLRGIRKDWGKDVLIGGATGVGYTFANYVSDIFTIGTPTVPFALGTYFKWIIIVVAAPVFETVLFLGVVLGKLEEYFERYMNWMHPEARFGIANFIQAFLFALFHSSAYGAFSPMSAAYVGAALFGIATGYLAKMTGSLLPAMVAHAIFNGFLMSKMVVVF